MKINGYSCKALHELACLLIEQHQLLQYAHREGLLEFVQGYINRAKRTLEEVVR